MVAHQAPLPMGFAKQEYWSGLPFPSPGDLPKPGIKPGSPALQAGSLLSEPPRKLRLGTFIIKWKLFNIHLFIWLPLVIVVACMISFASCRILHWRARTLHLQQEGIRSHGFQSSWCTGFVALCHVESYFPNQRSNTHPLARQILNTGPPGKSLNESLAGHVERVGK